MSSLPPFRPRVLVVGGVPPPHGGLEIVIRHLLDSSLRDTCELIHYDISKRRVVATKGRWDPSNLIFGILQPLGALCRILRYRPDALCTMLIQNRAGFLRYLPFIWMASAMRCRVVVWVAGDSFCRFVESTAGRFRRIVLATMERVDAFIVNARCLARQLAPWVPAEKIHVVYQGINMAHFPAAFVPRPPRADVRLLFAGYLTKAKGVLDFLEALPRVTVDAPEVRAQLMGPWMPVERNVIYIDNPTDNRQAIHSLIRKYGLANRVEFLGVQTGADKIRRFCEADVFVFPSYSESFPLVVLEAMAAGLPLVVTPVGALPEVLEENVHAYFVRPGDVEGIAAAVLKLMRDPAHRDRMGRENWALVRRQFNLASFGAGFSEAIAKTLDCRSRQPR